MSSDWPEPGAAAASTGGGTSVNARERHKLAERERRKSMRELFLSLHALLPHGSTVRKEQSAILDEINKYIPVAAARLRSLQQQKEAPPLAPRCSPPKVNISSSSSSFTSSLGGCNEDSEVCCIRMTPEPCSSVSISVRGDRVSVSLTDTKSGSSSHAISLSSIVDELEAHNLELIRSTCSCEGNRVVLHSESKICDGLERSPALLKERLEELARKLHELKKSSGSKKRSFPKI